MASTVVALTADVWNKVLTNVTYSGQVFIINQDDEPTDYLVAFVNTGDSAPAVDFDGGVKFGNGFVPSNDAASDYYVMPTDNAGKVVIFT